MGLIRLCGFMAALLVFASTLYAQDCLDEAFPIGEEVLLDVRGKWDDPVELDADERDSVLRMLNYVDSTGKLLGGFDVLWLADCALFDDENSNLVVTLYSVHGHEKEETEDRDENIHAVISQEDVTVDHLLLGQLITTCRSTYLYGSFLTDDGDIEVKTLEHFFDCDSAEYVRTERIRTTLYRVTEEGKFEKIEEVINSTDDATGADR